MPDVDEAERPVTSYAYKASLIGSAHRFELRDDGLSWHIGGRSGVWAYDQIAAIRLSYRPVSMQQHRFRADITSSGGVAPLDPVHELADRGADGGARQPLSRLHRRAA